MLETIRKTIDELPDKSFEEVFNEYLMEVQDNSINLEVDYTFKKLHDDIVDISIVISNEFEGLVDNEHD